MSLCNTYSFWASKRGNSELSPFLLLEHLLFWASFTFCNVLHKAERASFCDPDCARSAGLICISKELSSGSRVYSPCSVKSVLISSFNCCSSDESHLSAFGAQSCSSSSTQSSVLPQGWCCRRRGRGVGGWRGAKMGNTNGKGERGALVSLN